MVSVRRKEVRQGRTITTPLWISFSTNNFKVHLK
jgi:hypothetical protein